MRRFALFTALFVAFAAIGAALPNRAEAMTISTPAAVQDAVRGTLSEEVAYWCRRVWRCGYWGCGWRRACYGRPGPYAYYGYGWRRPYYHHRWHRWHHW